MSAVQNTSGDIYPFKFILLNILFTSKNNYTGLWYFFAGPLFITKVSQKSVRQYYFCASMFVPCSGRMREHVVALATSTHATDSSSVAVSDSLASLPFPTPRPTRPRPCRFHHCGRLFCPRRLTMPVRPSLDAPVYTNCGRFTRE